MDDYEFQNRAEAALSNLEAALGRLADTYDLDPEFHAGALTIEFGDPPARFVVSPNGPVRQIWVSAHSTSFKLDWDPDLGHFVFRPGGQTLHELVAELVSRQLGEEVTL
jgi:CyaY protein